MRRFPRPLEITSAEKDDGGNLLVLPFFLTAYFLPTRRAVGIQKRSADGVIFSYVRLFPGKTQHNVLRPSWRAAAPAPLCLCGADTNGLLSSRNADGGSRAESALQQRQREPPAGRVAEPSSAPSPGGPQEGAAPRSGSPTRRRWGRSAGRCV